MTFTQTVFPNSIIDHGKGTTDNDSGKVKKALSENRKILDENGYKTIAL